MTEEEWLTANDPDSMLGFLRGKVSKRKLGLFSAAGFRRLAHLLSDSIQLRGIDMLEQLAEGIITHEDCRNVTAEIRRAIPIDNSEFHTQQVDDLHYIGLMLYREFCSASIASHTISVTAGLTDPIPERQHQVRLMRCIFGTLTLNPKVVDPSWLTFDVRMIAAGAYEDLAFDRLPILADALQDAGCEDEDILNHLRWDGPHVRGCWALDLILGKS